MSRSDGVGRSDLAEFAFKMSETYPEHAYYCTPGVIHQLWEVLTERLPNYARTQGWAVTRMYTADSHVYHYEMTVQNAFLMIEGWRFERRYLAGLPVDDLSAWDYGLFDRQEEPWYLLRAWVFYLGQS